MITEWNDVKNNNTSKIHKWTTALTGLEVLWVFTKYSGNKIKYKMTTTKKISTKSPSIPIQKQQIKVQNNL